MVFVFVSGDMHAAQPTDESAMRGATALGCLRAIAAELQKSTCGLQRLFQRLLLGCEPAPVEACNSRRPACLSTNTTALGIYAEQPMVPPPPEEMQSPVMSGDLSMDLAKHRVSVLSLAGDGLQKIPNISVAVQCLWLSLPNAAPPECREDSMGLCANCGSVDAGWASEEPADCDSKIAMSNTEVVGSTLESSIF